VDAQDAPLSYANTCSTTLLPTAGENCLIRPAKSFTTGCRHSPTPQANRTKTAIG